MRDDLVSRKQVMDSITKEYNSRLDEGPGLKLAWIELAVNRVLEAEQWIPVEYHPLTEEEADDRSCPEGTMWIDSKMPEDGQEILVTTKWVDKRTGNVRYSVTMDTCLNDGDGDYLDSGEDWIDDVVAWMPLPEPYKEDADE